MTGRATDAPGFHPEIRVFIVDDHSLVRAGLRSFIDVQQGLSVVGEAADGQQALSELAVLANSGQLPDVVVMDVQMPRLDGARAQVALNALHPTLKIVILSSYVQPERVKALLQAGAAGYLEKSSSAERIVEAIRGVHKGEIYLDPRAAQALAKSLAGSGRDAALTERELQILVLLAKGLSNQEIADCLLISERTARTHVSHVLMKLGFSSRLLAALWALREGIVSVEDTR
ncbi:MAG: DNA-binding response regulator [Frankiales bacterium]|nr:DNA-binding response regulator [Frankiales bacterium]